MNSTTLSQFSIVRLPEGISLLNGATILIIAEDGSFHSGVLKISPEGEESCTFQVMLTQIVDFRPSDIFQPINADKCRFSFRYLTEEMINAIELNSKMGEETFLLNLKKKRLLTN